MTRRRWIADEASGDTAAITGDNARHLAQVLRARVGGRFDIAVDGRVRAGTVTRIAEDRVEFALGEELAAASTSAPATSAPATLLLAVFKFDRMEWAIEKATELGVAKIVPVIARRVDAHLATAAVKRAARWRKIAREAAQQSRRADVPQIVEPTKLKAALDRFSEERTKIVLSETEKARSLVAALREAGDSPVMLAIGPEGGWTPDELKLFAQQGWTAASLGATVLRAETAALAALAITSAHNISAHK